MTKYEMLKQRYEQGRISIQMLRVYVKTGSITPEQFKEITGEDY